MTQRTWAEGLAVTAAEQVRARREELGMSAQQLADECARLGMPIQRSVIANFENGRRANISIAEVMVMAAALRVAPIYLLFPIGQQREIEGLPGMPADPYAWATWFTGESRGVGDKRLSEEEPKPLEPVRELWPVLEEIAHYKSAIIEAKERLGEDGLASAERADEVLKRARARWDEAMSMRERNASTLEGEGAVPGSPEFRAGLDKAHDLAREAAVLSSQVKKAHEEAARYSHELIEIRSSERMLEGCEDEAREIIGRIRSNGWSDPDFGSEFAYLFAEKRSLTRRKRSRTR
ncbi:helix-turn-helix domain-containing protein [Streptomyces brevispora]|uniref:Helix-turn-helix domain-containing protein n=1 Tax=Streptomyces brevispora TaxID=887462 RepID=A0ABZ1G571_9ACTN|nr:helix-turn-helix domain-containing protein [Streptomyces brevispora]WSC14940.1 helix-turn-helix domain-containing protein [Streptomyces brevispora]